MIRKILFLLFPIALFSYSYGQRSNNISIGTRDSIYSKILNEKREFWISVPNDPENPGKQYPVVYLLDGDWHFHSFTGIVDHMDEFMGNSLIPDMIVVGIVNTDRGRDFTPTRDSVSIMNSGGANAFTDFLDKELIPYIDSLYPSADYRTLVGHSLGGLFAVNTLLKHGSMFDSYLILDPALHWDGQMLIRQSKALLRLKKFHNINVYMAIAHPMNPRIDSTQAMKDTNNTTLGFRSNILFANYLRGGHGNNMKFKTKYFENETHSTLTLPGSYEGLKYLFDFYKRPILDVLNDSSASIIVAHYKKITRTMGYPILPPSNLISGLAWRYRLDKRYDDGMNFLEILSKNYPDYPVIYDEMGIIMKETGKTKKSDEYFNKAKKLRTAMKRSTN